MLPKSNSMLLQVALHHQKTLIYQVSTSHRTLYAVKLIQISIYQKFTVVTKSHFLHSQIDVGYINEGKEYTARTALYVENNGRSSKILGS